MDKLQEQMREVGSVVEYEGYFYSIHNTLIMLVCGMLCGLKEISEIHQWLSAEPTQKMLNKQFGISQFPGRSQFYNILKIVDAEKFKLSFIKWMQGVLGQPLLGKTVAMDGKTVCGTDKLTKDGTILNIVSAYVCELKMVIGSNECTDKPGERQAFRELLELLDVKGTVIVADALHCNKKTINAISEAGADYLLAVKNNVPTLKSQIQSHIENCVKGKTISSHTTLEKSGGRIEKRTAYAKTNIDWLQGKDKWQNLTTIGAIHRQFEKNGNISSQWHYYISSAAMDSQQLLSHVRLEWGVESMHWLLDVHYTEDKTRVWEMNVQKILNTARKAALNLIHAYKSDTNQPKTPLSRIMRNNLFDLKNFNDFLVVLRGVGKLD
jgi:predicted transposase YbfD/YdcC